MAKNTTLDIPEAVPERTKLPQPKRTIEVPLPAGTRNTNSEPDTSHSVRGREITGKTEEGKSFKGEVPPAAFNSSVMEQLAEGARANDIPLPPQGLTTTSNLYNDPPPAPKPVFTDPSTQAPPPVGPASRADLRTKIQIGPIDEALVSEEKVVKVRPRFTGSRFIGPYRYYFTKDVVCEVPKSVRDGLIREELAYPYYE